MEWGSASKFILIIKKNNSYYLTLFFLSIIYITNTSFLTYICMTNLL